jgi:hypothetical protein
MVSIYVNTSISQVSTAIRNVGEHLLFVQFTTMRIHHSETLKGWLLWGFGGVSSRGQVRRTSSFAVKGFTSREKLIVIIPL